jgi:hypothetical protein
MLKEHEGYSGLQFTLDEPEESKELTLARTIYSSSLSVPLRFPSQSELHLSVYAAAGVYFHR